MANRMLPIGGVNQDQYPKGPQTWLVKDRNSERLEIIADEIASTAETLTFALKGQVVACINGWLWYRLHASDLPKT